MAFLGNILKYFNYTLSPPHIYFIIYIYILKNSILRLYRNENTTAYSCFLLPEKQNTRECMVYLRHRGHSCLDRCLERERSAQFHFTVVGIKKEEGRKEKKKEVEIRDTVLSVKLVRETRVVKDGGEREREREKWAKRGQRKSSLRSVIVQRRGER